MNAWVFWPGSLLCSCLALWGFYTLHQERPHAQIVLKEAAFIPYQHADRFAPPDWRVAVNRQLPHDWRGETEHFDRAWYRLETHLDTVPDGLWGLYVPGIEMTPIVHVNGRPVSEAQLFTDPLPRYWNRPVYFSLPRGLLEGGQNEITIQLAANDRWGRITELYLGPHGELFDHYQSRWGLRVGVMQTTAAICFGFACFVFSLWWVRKDQQFLSFSVLVLIWGLQNYVMAEVEPWFANVYWDLLIYSLMGLLTASACIFAAHYTNAQCPAWNRAVILIALAGPLVLLLITTFDVMAFNLVGSVIWIVLLLVLALRPTVLVMRNMLNNPSLETGALVVSFMLALPLATKDWLVTAGLGWRHDGFMFQFAAAPIVIAFGVIMLRKFVQALEQSEDLNATLGQRVAEQVAQIEVTHSRNRLLESQQMLTRERERIMRDMHDGLGGHLVGTLAQLDVSSPRDAGIVQDLQLALTDLRLMMDSMDHEMSAVSDILAVFRHRVEPRLHGAGIDCTWRLAELPPMQLDADRKLHLLRILQEVVTNTLKHAHATELHVTTNVDMRSLHIRIADNGCGIAGSAKHGRGMTNIQHRAALAGFQLGLVSAEGFHSGTQVNLVIPRQSAAPEPACTDPAAYTSSGGITS